MCIFIFILIFAVKFIWKKMYRIFNKTWQRYSQQIATMMLDKMERLDMSQTKLAELMGCSQQYVSKVLKGQENLSLETISKIETALDIRIMSLPQKDLCTGYSWTASATRSDYAMVAEKTVPYGTEKRVKEEKEKR